MAGQRMYWDNYLTNVKGPVVIQARVVCAGAATSYTATTGSGAALTVAHVGGTNTVTLTFPEKFGKCVSFLTNYVPAGAADASSVALPTTDYAPATGKATVSFGARGATNNAALAALNDPTGVLYVDATFELGM